jgi:hypothetical protein
MSDNESLAEKAARAPSLAGRLELLLALRRYWPDFWRALNLCVWQKGCGQEDLVFWADWAHLSLEDEWIFRDAVWPTLQLWTAQPDSGHARLDPAYRWFLYQPLAETIPVFQPAIAERPLVLAALAPAAELISLSEKDLDRAVPDNAIEPLAACRARAQAQFDRAWRDYQRLYNRRFGTSSPELRKHARWTALVMGGMSPTQIAAEWPGLKHNLRVEFPEKIVRTAVSRFARAIGLTLGRFCDSGIMT